MRCGSYELNLFERDGLVEFESCARPYTTTAPCARWRIPWPMRPLRLVQVRLAMLAFAGPNVFAVLSGLRTESSGSGGCARTGVQGCRLSRGVTA